MHILIPFMIALFSTQPFTVTGVLWTDMNGDGVYQDYGSAYSENVAVGHVCWTVYDTDDGNETSAGCVPQFEDGSFRFVVPLPRAPDANVSVWVESNSVRNVHPVYAYRGHSDLEIEVMYR